MNELQDLERICAAVPAPDRDRLAGIRARVLGGIADGTARQGPRRLITRPRVALTGAVAALAAGVTTAALVIPAGTGGVATSGHRVQLDAALVLHRAARAALTAPQPGDKPFIYINSQVYQTVAGHWQPSHLREGGNRPVHVEEWLSVTGHREGASRLFPCVTQLSGCLGPPVPIEPGFTYTGLQKLPAAPGALLGYLRRRHPMPCNLGAGFRLNKTEAEWEGINTILTDVPVLPARFGAALFNAAAHIPGVSLVRNATGPAGLHGIGVALTMTYPAQESAHVTKLVTEEMEVVFNPHTYRYVGNVWDYKHAWWGAGAAATELTSAGFASSAPAPKPGLNGVLGDLCPGSFI